MKLYHHPLSTYSQKVMIALHEKELPFDTEIVRLADPEARAAYERVYPLGKVPLLVADDGRLVPESTIIIEYLDGHFPEPPRLIPEGRDEARQVRFLDRMLDHWVNDPFVKIFFDGRQPPERRDPDGVARAAHHLDVLYRFMDDLLARRTWLAGEGFSMADCAAAPPLGYLTRIRPFERHPNLTAYWTRLAARPSVARVFGEAYPHLAAFDTV